MGGERTRQELRTELDESHARFHSLLDSLTEAEWDAPSKNPAWTNGQLMFHITFAFMLIPALYWMIRFWSGMPDRASGWFAAMLNFSTPAFNWINALGPRGQARVFGRRRIGAIYDRVHRSILRKVASLADDQWGIGMHYPNRWDPSFGDFMSFEDLFHYPTKHFKRHVRQLSAGSGEAFDE